MKPKFNTSKFRNHIAGASLVAGITICLSGSTFATTWVGGTSNDWNENTNWSGGAGTGGDNAVISTIPANISTISATIVATPVDILVGDGSGATGRLIQNAGNASTGFGNWLIVGRGTGTGTFDLANTAATGGALTGYGLGSGSMVVGNGSTGGRLYVGDGGTGTVNINTSGSFIMGNDLDIGVGNAGTGVFNLDAGTVTTGGWNFLGNGNGTNGTLNQSGGSFTNTGRTYVGGRDAGGTNTGTGHYNISGGTNTNSQNFSVGSGNLSAAAPSTLSVSGGTLNTPATSIGGAAFNGGDANAGNGTATVSGTGVINVNGELWVGQSVGSTGAVTVSGGAINVNSWLAVGRSGKGTITQSGGVVTKTGSGSVSIANFDSAVGKLEVSGGLFDVRSGDLLVGEGGGGTAELLFTGGQINAPRVLVATGGSVVSTVSFNGGTLSTGKIDGTGSGTSNVSFNGTSIVATGDQSAFITGIDSATISTGNLMVNSNSFAIGADQVLTGTGGVVKSGLGTLTLSGGSSYSGSNTVNAGKLVLNGDSTGTGAITVANGAALGLMQSTDSDSLDASSVTFGSASGATTLELNIFSPAVAALNVTGTLTLNGPVMINIVDAFPPSGVIPLVSYTGTKAGTGSFVLGTLPPGVVATLNDNGTGLVSINFMSQTYWNGTTNGNWDTTTLNWYDQLSSSSVKYVNMTSANFNDFAAGTTDVSLSGTITPQNVFFTNDSLPYTLGGLGKITGTTGLTKSGIATLAISASNDYTGVTLLAGGTTSVGTLTNGGVASPLGAASSAAGNLVLAGGTLNYTGGAVTVNRSLSIAASDNTIVSGIAVAANLTLTGQISATKGKLAKSGAGTLILAGTGANVLANGSDGDAVPPALSLAEGGLLFNGAGQTNSVTGRTAFGTAAGVTTAEFANSASFTGSSQTFVALGGNSTATLTVGDTSQLQLNSNFLVGQGASSVGNVIIEDSGKITKTGGYFSLGIGTASTATMTVRNSGKFVTDGDFNVGDVNGALGTINTADSAAVTAAGGLFIGKNNTMGTVNMSGHSTVNSNSINIGGGTGSHGMMNITGNAIMTSVNSVQVGAGAGSMGDVVISGAGSLVVNSFVSVGYGGGGTMTVKDTGSFSTNDDFSVNENGDVPATVTTQDSATFSMSGTLYIGRGATKVGTLTISGASTVNQTGVAKSVLVGAAGTGTLNIQGTAKLSAVATTGVIVTNNATGTGTVNLDGGTLTTVKVSDGGGNSTFNFNGGLLKAGTTANPDFLSGLDSAVVKTGGAFIDSNGQTITISQVLGGSGSLTKQGAGTLTLSGVNSYTGNTTVSAGTLTLANDYLANASTVTIASGAVLNLTHSATDQVGALIIAGVSQPSGIYDATSNPGVITGTGKLQVIGSASPYATWISGYFPSVTDPAIIGPDADPDHDGSSNALEFALGGVPNSGSNGPKVYNIVADGSVDVDTNKELLITIAVRSGAPVFTGSPSPTSLMDGYNYTIQGSANLAVFTNGVTPVAPVTTGLPAVPAGYEYRTFSLDGSNNLPTKGFLRVKINP